MLDDKNKDPTFIYTVPDTVYEVPTPARHAAKIVGMPGGLGYMLKGDSFIGLIEDAYYLRQDVEIYCKAWAEAYSGNKPSPIGGTEAGEKYDDSSRARFARQFESAAGRMHKAGRSLAYPDNDAGLWIPLSDN